jgi:hypothetical protein
VTVAGEVCAVSEVLLVLLTYALDEALQPHQDAPSELAKHQRTSITLSTSAFGSRGLLVNTTS